MTKQPKTKNAAKDSQGTTAKSAAAKKTTTTVAARKKSPSPTEKQVTASAQKKATAKGTATPAPKVAAKKATNIDTGPTKVKKAAPAKIWVKPTPEERYRMVETAAYFLAERNNFQGDPTGYWAAAEIEIATLLGE